MTLPTLLLGRLLPTVIAVACLALTQRIDPEFVYHSLRKFNALPVIGIMLIWFPDTPYLSPAPSNPIVEAALRLFGWLLILVHALGVLLMLR